MMMDIIFFQRNSIMIDRRPVTKHKWQVWHTPFSWTKNGKKRTKGRPFLIIDIRKDAVVGHKITSRQWQYKKNHNDYYKVKDKEKAGLTEDSFVDLNEVLAHKKDLEYRQGTFSRKDITSFTSKKREYLRKKSKKKS